jgi:crossover junction endodeoxyribonuclease RuvC
MNKNITSLGLDLSLTGTGVVVLTDGKLIHKQLIKSKPNGDKPINELIRLCNIVSEIKENIIKDIDITVIENLAFGIKKTTSLTQLAGLNYLTRLMLHELGIPFVLVAPPSLKKFITGKGIAQKDIMMLETYKKYGVSILEDNICDAYGLAQIGLALLDGNSKETTKIQKEVINILKKQL